MGQDQLSGSPIQVAAKLGHVEVVQFLIESGVDVNIGTLFSTPLLDAIATRHFEIALKLIEAGADPNLTAEFDCVMPIAIAAVKGNASVMQALIDAGAEVDVVVPRMSVETESVMDSTALILAARWGQAAVVEVLVNAGAECDRVDGTGLSAIEWAEKNHHLQVLERLQNISNFRVKPLLT